MRTILHCDCNSFFASVEIIDNPALKDVPMAVGGSEKERHGIILAKNEPAKKYGVVTAETIHSAKKKCPELVIVPPRHRRYEEISKAVNEIYREYTEFVEPFGIDESWLDVTDVKELFGDGKKIADTIRERTKKEIGLTVSVGVSFTKSFAKLGSDYKKPDATTVIMPRDVKTIVYPQPLGNLLFAGRKITEELEKIGIYTIGDLARCDRDFIEKNYGKNVLTLYNYATGQDDDPVRSIYEKTEVKSIGNSYTFPKSLVGEDEVRGAVLFLADTVSTRLRAHKMKCSSVSVTIKYDDLKSISRQMGLTYPTSSASELSRCAMNLILKSRAMARPIRLLGISAQNLTDEGKEQVTMFDELDNHKKDRLDSAIDRVREKFGSDILKYAGESEFKTETAEDEEGIEKRQPL